VPERKGRAASVLVVVSICASAQRVTGALPGNNRLTPLKSFEMLAVPAKYQQT
jgi:hypothetical protein